MRPFYKATAVRDPEQEKDLMEYLTGKCGYTEREAKRALDSALDCPVVVNDKYHVFIEDGDPWVHLSIKRRDRKSIHDWRELQEIKNALVGPECEGVELYPAQSRVVDVANQYHLYVLKEPGRRLPLGYQEGMRSEDPAPGAKQRPFDKE